VRRGIEILGLPVLSISEGKTLGKVTGLLVDRQQREVAVLRVGGGGWFSHDRFLPYADIRGVGPDAVTVASAEALREPKDIPNLKELDAALVDRVVVTESGQKIGRIAGLTVDEGSGNVACFLIQAQVGGLNLPGGRRADEYDLPSDLVTTVGPEAVVVSSTVTHSAADLSASATRA
jgi:uncharacterized protein YrrD